MEWNPQIIENYYPSLTPELYPYYGTGYPLIQEPEANNVKKDEEENKLFAEIESNRTYLTKLKKECVKETFEELNRLQMFLFEVLIESLEVTDDCELGLVTDIKDLTHITARVQFLNSPYLEICENNKTMKDVEMDAKQTEFFETVIQAGLNEAYNTGTNKPVEDVTMGHQKEVEKMIKWENGNGKSCLFPMTALQIIQDLNEYPVIIQVVRRTLPQSQDSTVPNTLEPIAYTRFQLPEEFSLTVLQSCKEGVVLPVTSVHRETCDLQNVFGVTKGKIKLFVRLSSFGPVIITSFQTFGVDFYRKYVFKPSSVTDDFQEQSVPVTPIETLKPLIAEEDKAVGISVVKEADIFQRPVLWKMGTNACGCETEGECFCGKNGPTMYTSMSSMRLPTTSELSLCRDVRPPTDFRKTKQYKDTGHLCDWHNLVCLEVKNSPEGNCGCLSSPTSKRDNNILRENIVKNYLKSHERKPINYRNDLFGPNYFDSISTNIPEINGITKSKIPDGLRNWKSTDGLVDRYKNHTIEHMKYTNKNAWDCCPCVKKDDYEYKIEKKSSLRLHGKPSLEDSEKSKPLFKKKYSLNVQSPLLETKPFEENKHNEPVAKCGCVMADPNEIPPKRPVDETSRMMKMRPVVMDLKPKTGFGFETKDPDCGCKCPDIKASLDGKTLFLI